MSQILDPVVNRDFSGGRVSKSAVATSLVPANSVANSFNVDYSEIIGSAILRKGKQQVQQIVTNYLLGQNQLVTNDNSNKAFGSTWLAQTFTPTSGQTPIGGITLALVKTGSPTDCTVSIYNTSAGAPSTLIQSTHIAPSLINGTSFGTDLSIPFLPNVTVTPGTVYAIVLTVAGDSSNYVVWDINTAGGYAGGSAQVSTNAGVSWSAIGTADFLFRVYYVDPATTYNAAPLGFWAGPISNAQKSVLAFDNNFESNNGDVYYYNSSTWVPSNLVSLANVKIRFAVMNGSIFEANGSDFMHDSANGGQTWGVLNSITTDGVDPSLLIVAGNRLLASGWTTFPSRVYFSSLVNPAGGTTFLSWNTDPTAGDWIDIDPDSGGIVTGFANTSSLTLVFKNNGMYRLNTIARSVDAENIFNVGAVSQEGIISCLGIVYFYSGNGIYSTDGTFPQQISRIGVQDFIDAIQTPTQVYSGTDGFNVYFSIGQIVLTYGPEDIRTYNNVVLKFSPRDQNWQIFYYNQHLAQMVQFGIAGNDSLPYALEFDGYVSKFNSAIITDDSKAISYELETQELEFTNRSHTKNISDKIIVF